MGKLSDRIKQILGQSTTDLVCQKTITDELAKKQDAATTNIYTATEKAYVALIPDKQDKILPLSNPSESEVMQRLRLTGLIDNGSMNNISLVSYNLINAVFINTALRNANLSACCLVEAKIYNCNLSGSSFSGSFLAQCDFFHSNLTNCTGFKSASIDDAFSDDMIKVYSGLELIWIDGYIYKHNGASFSQGVYGGINATFNNTAVSSVGGGTDTTGTDTTGTETTGTETTQAYTSDTDPQTT